MRWPPWRRRPSETNGSGRLCGWSPESTLPAFAAAIEALHEHGFIGDPGGPAQLKRRMIERVLTRYEDAAATEIDPILTLLRRFATEAAREEARLFCQELVAA